VEGNSRSMEAFMFKDSDSRVTPRLAVRARAVAV
jgi:hypothetical protein